MMDVHPITLVVLGLTLYIFLAALCFTIIDTHLNGEFRDWYDKAPFEFLKFLLWVFWPILALIYLYEYLTDEEEEK